MTRSFTVAFLFTLIFSSGVFAQYQVKHFSTENGLPSNGIKGMQWDEATGFLWIATEAGLVRYNGMNFKTFDVTTNPELGSNRIVKLAKNASGKILVAGEEGNLSVVNENTVTLFLTGSSFAKNNLNHYCAFTATDTLYRKCLNNPWPSSIFHIHNTSVVTLNDTACIAFSNGRIYYYSVTTNQPVKISTDQSKLKYLFKITGQLYYLDSLNQLFSFDPYQRRSRPETMIDTAGKPFMLKKENSNLFWQDGMQSPVLIQEGNAWILEKENNKPLQLRLVASGIPQNAYLISAQYIKSAEYLFLGTASKGVYLVHQNLLISKKPAESNISQVNAFYSQIELPNGNIITNDGTIIGSNPSRDHYNIGSYFLRNVFSLNDSSVIFSRQDSLFEYNKNRGTRNLMFTEPTSENYSFAFLGKDLYFANQKGIGIIKENKSIDYKILFDSGVAKQFRPYSMIAISPSKLVLASCDGLMSFDIRTRKLDTILKLPFTCIRTLHKDGAYIFIGTYGGGFFVMKDGKIKAMPLDINQYLRYTHCFIKDDNNFYWISTNNGLFKVKLADMIAAYEKNLSQIYYHYLGKEDGMETTEMNGGCSPCALRLKNGNFSFPTMDGMLWFNPEKTNILLPSGKIYIDKLLVDDKQELITGKEIIQLAETTKKLDISLTINAWCKKENLYIDYKLNNAPWRRTDITSGNPRIIFDNLSYGNYTLVIRKMNGFGVNNYSYSTISFNILTPFYQRWWFRILILFALALLGYLIFRLRLRQYDIREKKLSALVEQKTMDLNLKNIQLEKNDQIKTRLISVINHDIITPLKFMHYAGKALVDKKETISREEKMQTISEIAQTAKDMEMLSSQILNWIIYQNPNERMQKEEFNLRQLVDMVFSVLQFPAKVKNTRLESEVPTNFVVYQYMEPLRVLIYNLVLNSINFTKEGLVTVESRMADDRIIIQVTDNGMGMSQDQIDNILSDEKIIVSANVSNKKGTGLGYMIIKDLLKMMSGTLVIKSNRYNGTTVIVSLPAK
jgi:signal transduction histidine kinase